MHIGMYCGWDLSASANFLDYVDPAHEVIKAYADQSGETYYVTGRGLKETLQRPYSRGALEAAVSRQLGELSATVGLWNAKEGPEEHVIHLSMIRPGPVPSAITINLVGDMDQLFAMEAIMLRAVDRLGGKLARVIDREAMMRLADEQPTGISGVIAFVRSGDAVPVDGFTIRRHGNGTVFVLDRSLADTVERRAAAIAKLRPLWAGLS